jgi:hypothetical protein
MAIILHNMLVEWERNEWSKFWQLQYNCEEEFDPNDGGPEEVLDTVLQGNGEANRNIFVEELVTNNERAGNRL